VSRQTKKEEEEMDKNQEKVKLQARDLRDGKQFPRSPRQTLAGYHLSDLPLELQDTWRIIFSSSFRVTEWCITGSTCTI
jgi:hypothetical protein